MVSISAPEFPRYDIENPDPKYMYTNSPEYHRSEDSLPTLQPEGPSSLFFIIPMTVKSSTSQPVVTSRASKFFSQPRNLRTLVSSQALELLRQHLMGGVGRGNLP